jgi:hypothetical protein
MLDLSNNFGCTDTFVAINNVRKMTPVTYDTIYAHLCYTTNPYHVIKYNSIKLGLNTE